MNLICSTQYKPAGVTPSVPILLNNALVELPFLFIRSTSLNKQQVKQTIAFRFFLGCTFLAFSWCKHSNILKFVVYDRAGLWQVNQMHNLSVMRRLLIHLQAYLTWLSFLFLYHCLLHATTFPSIPVESWGTAYFDQADVRRLWRVSVCSGGDLDAVHCAGVSSWFYCLRFFVLYVRNVLKNEFNCSAYI